ncbi:MAG: permease [Clostridia bacterium]|nr:permease [Clostridia bacterium]
MTKIKKFIKRYLFFFLLVLINIILLFFKPEIARGVTKLSLDSLKEMLSIIPPIFIILGLMDVWVPKETIMKYMGKGSGLKGGIFAFILGSFSAGPLYASFPIAAIFLKKGVSLTNIFIFIGAWSATKIPMMLFEVAELGMKFAVSRFILNIITIIVLAFVMEKTTSKKEAKKIYEKATEQTDKD